MKNKKSIITIGGTLGSGKSSTGNLLAEHLGFQRFSMGDVQREYAKKLNMDFTAFSEMQKTDHTIDKQVDAYQQELADKEDDFILDSRLGWYFIPESFKVFLEVPEEVAAERIMRDAEQNPNRQVEIIETKEDVIERIHHRVDSERKRYRDLYGIEDHFERSHYDLVIRTDQHNLEEVVAIIREAYEAWRQT
jgi:cytidylate kinase